MRHVDVLNAEYTQSVPVGARVETDKENKNILLHKDKGLSTSRLFYRSVPDDKRGNTQYVKQEYKYLQQTKVHLKNKTKNYSCLKPRSMQTQQSKTDANLNFQRRERDSYKIILND